MISIYKEHETEQLCKDYCDGFTCENGNKIKGMVEWVKNRIQTKIENTDLAKIDEIKSVLTDYKIRNILSSNGQKLLNIWENEFKKYENVTITYNYKNKKKDIKSRDVNFINYIFNYDSFRKCNDKKQFRGFLLSEKLGIKCCPYCNRNYTTSHQTFNKDGKEKNVFPEFDHFYHKSSYPLLAISFYNLIPSCNICNTHYKGKKDSTVEKIFNPFTKVKKNHFEFKFIPKTVESFYGKNNNFELDFNFNEAPAIKKQIENSIKFFGIKDNYEKCHSNLIKEIVNKKLTYSNKYLNIIKDTYGIGFEESYRILFESYYEEDKLHQRPFSKLKKDIFDDVDIK